MIYVVFKVMGGGMLVLCGDGVGYWCDGVGCLLLVFDGCIDIDIVVMLFINLLLIGCFGFVCGEWWLIDVVYILMLDLMVVLVK